MVVEHVINDNQLSGILNTAEYRLVVIDFYADWYALKTMFVTSILRCPPCRMIAPIFEQLSNYYKDVVFVKVNVDNCRSRPPT